MACHFLRSLLIVVVSVSLAGQVHAQEKSQAKDPASDIGQPSDIPALIKQLDAEEFAQRQNASAKLTAAAEAAVPALEKAAKGESREASMRAFEILKGHFENGSSTLKDTAKQSLDRIAKAELGVASRRANEILTPPIAPNPAAQARNIRAGFAPAMPGMMPVPAFAPAPGGIRIAGARVVIAAAAGGGGTETKIRVENGVKTTEVKDKDRQVKIVDDPDKGLQLEVTETKDGKEKTEKFAAKNADELKSKHPEAHKIFEQYSQKGADIKIGGFGAIPGAIPVPGPIAPAAPARAMRVLTPRAVPAKKGEGLEESEKKAANEAQKRIEEMRKRLEELREAVK